MKNVAAGINWIFPLLGAIGFGIGFASRCAIMSTNYDLLKFSLPGLLPTIAVLPEIYLLKGMSVGAMGGAALGLPFKDKRYTVYFSLAGAVGFAIGFALVMSIIPREVPVAGAIIGSIGGLVLGIASPKERLLTSLLLGSAGVLWFAMAFAFGSLIFNGNMCSSWNGWGGAIGGAIFGLVLAMLYKNDDRVNRLHRRKKVESEVWP